MQFSDIRGQDGAINTLKRALVSQKVHHAYLFSGRPGVGKRPTAYALAMALNCGAGLEDACGVCSHCEKIRRGVHPDLFFLTLPEGKKIIPIESVRSLSAMLSTGPYEGAAKVAIIDPADQLSESAANALLKTLEEPRPGNFLILITAKASSLLPTVRSRCQQVRFRALSQDIVSDLLEQQGVDPQDAKIASALGEGSMEQALAYLNEDMETTIDGVIGLLENADEPMPGKGLDVIASYRGKRPAVLALLDLMTIVLGELLWLGTQRETAKESVLADRIGERMHRLSESLSVVRTAQFVAVAHRAIEEITRNNANPQLALEGMLMSMRGRAGDSLAGSGFGVQ